MRLLPLFIALVACGPSGGATVPEDSGTTTTATTATGTGTTSGTTGTATGTGTGTDTTTIPFGFWSPDLVAAGTDPLANECGELLPAQYSCYGPNPEIRWEGLPAGTTHLVLIFDDPDAGNYPHWGIYDIPAAETGLARGISGQAATSTPPAGVGELTNGFGFTGYLGSCPPTAHVYRWRLFAMDATVPGTPQGTPAQQFDTLEQWATGNALDSLEFCHIYRP